MTISLLFLSGCTYLFFEPGRELVDDAEIARHAPEEMRFNSSDGTALVGWYFSARGKPLGTILVCHGNVENMSTHVKLDLWLVDAGYNVFIFDYRGYGKSDGTPDVKSINQDADAALEALLSRTDGGIIVFGKSLGGAVAVYTVAHSRSRARIKGLIIESAFASYRMIAREKIADSIIGWPFQYPLSLLVNDEYSPVDHIKKIAPIPVLIIHGYDDHIVPQHHGRILYDAAGEPKEYWELNVQGHVKSWTDEATRARLLGYFTYLDRS
jgi:alpha-beta hydrolase superfamily lysophospholipase